jgi:hypothetical protein
MGKDICIEIRKVIFQVERRKNPGRNKKPDKNKDKLCQ